MSLAAWAWVFRPDRREYIDVPTWVAGQILLLFAVIVAAWTTSLLANCLRILVAMNLPAHGDGLHRLIGMLVYVPLLSLQLHLGERGNWKAALAGPVILYLLLMAVGWVLWWRQPGARPVLRGPEHPLSWLVLAVLLPSIRLLRASPAALLREQAT